MGVGPRRVDDGVADGRTHLDGAHGGLGRGSYSDSIGVDWRHASTLVIPFFSARTLEERTISTAQRRRIS